jgi:hypothetical protein
LSNYESLRRLDRLDVGSAGGSGSPAPGVGVSLGGLQRVRRSGPVSAVCSGQAPVLPSGGEGRASLELVERLADRPDEDLLCTGGGVAGEGL